MSFKSTYDRWTSFRDETGKNIAWALGLFALLGGIYGAARFLGIYLMALIPLSCLMFVLLMRRWTLQEKIEPRPLIVITLISIVVSSEIYQTISRYPDYTTEMRMVLLAYTLPALVTFVISVLTLADYVGTAIMRQNKQMKFYEVLIGTMMERIPNGQAIMDEANEKLLKGPIESPQPTKKKKRKT